MAKEICTKCDGHGMVGPTHDPDACFDCGGNGYYDDGDGTTEGDWDRRQKRYAALRAKEGESHG